LGIILAAVYTLNMIRKIFFGELTAVTANAQDMKLNEKLVMGIIVILVFWFGVYPQALLNITDELSQVLVNKMEISHLLRKQ
jgi:NADH-quinone oxidoreductase subunit M